MYTVRRKTGIRIPVARGWYLYTDYLISKAVKLFGSYRLIHTSRLHGHILSCLMDKQNILIDNSYGKNSSYYYTWTHQCGNTELYLKENVSSH
ncbi:putative pyruvyl transferase EpsO [compost metagenome]